MKYNLRQVLEEAGLNSNYWHIMQIKGLEINEPALGKRVPEIKFKESECTPPVVPDCDRSPSPPAWAGDG